MTDKKIDPERQLADARAAFWTALDGWSRSSNTTIHGALDAVDAAAQAYGAAVERARTHEWVKSIDGYPDTPVHPGPWWPEAALNSAEAETVKWQRERNQFLNAMVKAQAALRKYGAHRTVERVEHGRILCPADPQHVARGTSGRCECGLEAALKGDVDGE